MKISRRNFVGGALGFAVAGGSQLVAIENSDAQERVPPWKKGEFQIHFIHTGVGESQFLIFPDGTTMLLDCPGNPAVYLGRALGELGFQRVKYNGVRGYIVVCRSGDEMHAAQQSMAMQAEKESGSVDSSGQYF